MKTRQVRRIKSEGQSKEERQPSVNARKDKEGRRLSSVDHEKDRAVDVVFVRSGMTNEDVDDSEFVTYGKSIESIGFQSYASGPVQETQESVLQGKTVNHYALTSRKDQCSKYRVRLMTFSSIHSLSSKTKTERVEMRIAVLTFE